MITDYISKYASKRTAKHNNNIQCFSTKYGRFYLGDARILIKNLRTSSVDIVITDPPHGLGVDKYDDENVFYELLHEIYRVLKPDAYMVVYYNVKKLPVIFKRMKYFSYIWTLANWHLSSYSKSVIGDLRWQPIIVFGKGKPRPVQRRWDVSMHLGEIPFIQAKGLPKQFKPTTSTMYLLSMFTHENDLVLDPFAGYGSIPFTCEIFRRRWIAYEIDRQKYDYAKNLFIRHNIQVSTCTENSEKE